MKPILFAIVLLTAIFDSNAQPIATETKSRDWPEQKRADGIITKEADKYVDYKRDGKIVIRSIERSTYIHPESKEDGVTSRAHIIDFVVNDKVFASFALDKSSSPSWTVYSAVAVGIDSGFTLNKERRYFHVCVPTYDYYEYLEVSDADIQFPMPEKTYAFQKKRA